MSKPIPLRVQEQWLFFREAALPANASSVQLQEMRRSFYAGAEALLNRIILPLLTPGTEAEDADLEMLDDIQREFADFARRVKAGSA